MENCIFCKIAAREIPAEVIYEDDFVLAFKDINPAADTHILIIPKLHIESVMDLNEENIDMIGKIHLAAVKIARSIGLDKTGFRLINNCGKGAGQTVFHIHYHLLAGKQLGSRLI